LENMISWDDSIMTKPIGGEIVSVTYFDKLHGGMQHSFNNGIQIDQQKWGVIVLDDEDNELLYHNFWSSRTKLSTYDPVPKYEMDIWHNPINRASTNSRIILEYLNNKQGSLADFLKKYPD